MVSADVESALAASALGMRPAAARRDCGRRRRSRAVRAPVPYAEVWPAAGYSSPRRRRSRITASEASALHCVVLAVLPPFAESGHGIVSRAAPRIARAAAADQLPAPVFPRPAPHRPNSRSYRHAGEHGEAPTCQPRIRIGIMRRPPSIQPLPDRPAVSGSAEYASRRALTSTCAGPSSANRGRISVRRISQTALQQVAVDDPPAVPRHDHADPGTCEGEGESDVQVGRPAPLPPCEHGADLRSAREAPRSRQPPVTGAAARRRAHLGRRYMLPTETTRRLRPFFRRRLSASRPPWHPGRAMLVLRLRLRGLYVGFPMQRLQHGRSRIGNGQDNSSPNRRSAATSPLLSLSTPPLTPHPFPSV
jgi:hypothetical protein